MSGIAVEATYREFLQKVVSGQLSLKDSDLDWSSYLHQVMESQLTEEVLDYLANCFPDEELSKAWTLYIKVYAGSDST